MTRPTFSLCKNGIVDLGFNVVHSFTYPLNFANIGWAAHLDMATFSPADGPPSLYDSDVIFCSYLFFRKQTSTNMTVSGATCGRISNLLFSFWRLSDLECSVHKLNIFSLVSPSAISNFDKNGLEPKYPSHDDDAKLGQLRFLDMS